MRNMYECDLEMKTTLISYCDSGLTPPQNKGQMHQRDVTHITKQYVRMYTLAVAATHRYMHRSNEARDEADTGDRTCTRAR